MKRFITVLSVVLFFTPASAGQETFIKVINNTDSSTRIRVLPTSDNGWVIFSMDSLKLYKFNSCGVIEWSNKYPVSKNQYTGDFITTSSGGFAILNAVTKNGGWETLFTMLDASGNIIWSKLYEDPLFFYGFYRIIQDASGNFILCGSVQPKGGGSNTYNVLCKINSNGDIIWKQFYDGCCIWGAIATSDNGVLLRTAGNGFIKTDSVGNLQWMSWIKMTATYYYTELIEVNDGYIFNGYNNGTNNIFFAKIDKQGNLLWGNRKIIDYLRTFWTVPSFRKKNNGNFAGAFNKIISGKNYPTVIEFDKDLNVISQSSINYSQPGDSLWGRDICFLNDSTSVLAGVAKINTMSYLFFAKMDNQYQTNCDTTLSVNITTDSVSQSFLSSNISSLNINVVNQNLTAIPFSVSTTDLCSSAKFLEIGNDTVLCPDATLTLQNKSNGFLGNYFWSTGDNTESITVNQPGTYRLLATYNCGQDTLMDSVNVSKVDFPIPSMGSDAFVCNNDSVFLNAEIAGGVYRWQDGSTNPEYFAYEPGDYFVDITYSQCTKRFETHISSCERIPNVFTPNGDGDNDFFVLNQFGLKSIDGKIFNRWGELIYRWNDIRQGWNGTILNSGKEATEGVYFYLIQLVDYKNEFKTYSGFIHLIR